MILETAHVFRLLMNVQMDSVGQYDYINLICFLQFIVCKSLPYIYNSQRL